MNLVAKTDKEIIEIANPLWDHLIRASNNKDYGSFTKDFSETMLMAAHEVEMGKQWASNKLLTTLSDRGDCLGCLRRNEFVTVLYKQNSSEASGDYLGRLVLGTEHDEVKIFGATIF